MEEYAVEEADNNATSSSTALLAHSSVCDRRLSRAAREIIRRSLEKGLALLKYNGAPAAHDDEPFSLTIWELLDRSLTQNQSCPLHYDILKHHEQSSHELRSPPSVHSFSAVPFQRGLQGLPYTSPHALALLRLSAEQRRREAYQRSSFVEMKQEWFQCALCGKMFTSQYYLDAHLDRKHAHQVSSSDHQDSPTATTAPQRQPISACPAVDWCRFLSLPLCRDMALELEPFYGRGSAGLRNDGISHENQRHWYQQAHGRTCQPVEMRAAAKACRTMIQTCFAEQKDKDHTTTRNGFNRLNQQQQAALADFLEHSLCDSISCEHRIHNLFLASQTSGLSRQNSISSHSNLPTGSASTPAYAKQSYYHRHTQEWKQLWSHYYAQHHSLGFWGMTLLICLFLWYYCVAYVWYWDRARRRPQQSGSRLLLRKSSSSTMAENLTGPPEQGRRRLLRRQAKRKDE